MAESHAIGVGRVFLTRVLVDPVRTGRLRASGWPNGLGAVVALAYLAYLVGLVVVVASSTIRERSELTIASASEASLPRGSVWVLIALVLVALALFQTSAVHAPLWLRIISLTVSSVLMGTWGIRGTTAGGELIATIVTAAAIVALIIFTLLRGPRRFAWWDFVVVFGLLAGPVLLGMAEVNRSARPQGFDFTLNFLGSTMSSLAPAALPAAVAAGLSVAEITVSATVWATRLTARLAARRAAYVIMVGLLVLRISQAGYQLAGWDFVAQPAAVWITWLLLAALLALLCGLMLTLAGARDAITVSVLPDRMAAMALPLGLGLVGLTFIGVVALGAFSVAGALAPTQVGAQSGAWLGWLSSTTGPNIARLLLAALLIGLAVRAARRGDAGVAFLLSAVAVLVIGRTVRWASGGVLDTGVGVDALNLLATAVLVVLIALTALRRRLSPARAVGFSGALVLSALLGYHDFVSDPLGALLGFSGAGLLIFGLCWGLLTDSAYANEGSPRFPLPTRVLFVLANAVIAMSILAYTSLARDRTSTINLDDFAVLGDEVLGTGLLAATFVAVLVAVRRDQPVA